MELHNAACEYSLCGNVHVKITCEATVSLAIGSFQRCCFVLPGVANCL